ILFADYGSMMSKGPAPTGDPAPYAELWILSLADRTAKPYLKLPDGAAFGQISPDGRWVAYVSRARVWVQSYPIPRTKFPLPSEALTLPRWRRDGKELFASSRTAGSRMWSISVTPNGPDALILGAPVLLFDHRFFPNSDGPFHTNHHIYAVSADGQRFLAPV